jgi:hypothetical protein
MLARSLGYITILDPNVKCNFIQHCFCDLRSHFEALESVLLKKKLSSTPRKNMIKLTLVPHNAYLSPALHVVPTRVKKATMHMRDGVNCGIHTPSLLQCLLQPPLGAFSF